jgi:hypothetical protein
MVILVLCCSDFRKMNNNCYTAASIITAIIMSNVTYWNSLYQRYPVANHHAWKGSHFNWECRSVSINFSMLLVIKTRVQVTSGPVITAMAPYTHRWPNRWMAALSWLWSCQLWETEENIHELLLQKILWSWITCHLVLELIIYGAIRKFPNQPNDDATAVSTELFW